MNYSRTHPPTQSNQSHFTTLIPGELSLVLFEIGFSSWKDLKNKVSCKGWSKQQTLDRKVNIHQRYILKPDPVHHCSAVTSIRLESGVILRSEDSLEAPDSLQCPLVFPVGQRKTVADMRPSERKRTTYWFSMNSADVYSSMKFSFAASCLVFFPVNDAVLSTHKCLNLKLLKSFSLFNCYYFAHCD